MKRLLLIAALLLLNEGCNGCRNDWKHFQSNVIGVNRKVTLYASDGSVIRTWTTTSKVEDKGGTIYFIDNNGNVVTVSGTLICEEG